MSGPTRTLPTHKRVRRCSRPLCSSQPTTRHHPHAPARPAPPRRRDGGTRNRTALNRDDDTHPTRGRPVPSGPNSVPTTPVHARDSGPRTPEGTPYWEPATAGRPNWSAFHPRAPPHTLAGTRYGHRSRRGRGSGPLTRGERPVLLRKEVIQPHLPVRLPCYDFVPIADPAFDGSLPQGVGPPASGVTDFRDVTGGVYKARERIHRSVADLRLLATPTSWGRVADPNPN